MLVFVEDEGIWKSPAAQPVVHEIRENDCLIGLLIALYARYDSEIWRPVFLVREHYMMLMTAYTWHIAGLAYQGGNPHHTVFTLKATPVKVLAQKCIIRNQITLLR